MQQLRGMRNSTIIDDTYNASPAAVKAALDFFYDKEAPYKIAVLGSINEFGEFSESAHKEVASYLDPKRINLLITVGVDAEKFIAASFKSRGGRAESYLNPFMAGDFLTKALKDNTLVLAKGSQNLIYTEEVIKKILADPTDASKLVRQSPEWMQKKQEQFLDR